MPQQTPVSRHLSVLRVLEALEFAFAPNAKDIFNFVFEPVRLASRLVKIFGKF
jgi:hypothetical protein